MNILVINAGSSSIKYQLIDIKTQKPIAKGLVERIGIDGGIISYSYVKEGKSEKITLNENFPTHEDGMHRIAKFLTDEKVGVISDPSEIKAVGHRIVQGAEKFSAPTVVTPAVVEELRKLIPLAPLHNPAHIQGIEVAQKVFDKAVHVLVFDTAFHQTMPPKAFRYAIPNNYYTENQIRVYGFHGTSHGYVYKKAKEYLKNDKLKAITLHLGNGSSMAAIDENGHCIDTSMGLTPLDGLVMGTRCGDIDASVVFYMAEELGLSVSEIKDIFNKQSGLFGLIGFSDGRDLRRLFSEGDENAILAMNLLAYRAQKYIGSYLAALNGADTLIFTAGLGENHEMMRSEILKNLDFFGIKIDEKLNLERNSPDDIVEIQSADSKIKILVVPTNEELEIALQTYKLIYKN